MKPTKQNFELLKELGAVFVQTVYKFENIDREAATVYVYRKDMYKKRNRKSAHVDYPGKTIKVPPEFIRTGVHYSEGMASHYFQQDDMMTTYATQTHYIVKEHKQTVINMFLNQQP
jgi:hypothetical protein